MYKYIIKIGSYGNYITINVEGSLYLQQGARRDTTDQNELF